MNMNLLRKTDSGVMPVSFSGQSSSNSMASGASQMGISVFPEELKEGSGSYLTNNYDVLAGSYPKEATDLVLVIDANNRLDTAVLENLGFDTANLDTISFDDIVGTQLKLVPNDDYYQKTEYGTFVPGQDYAAMYESENAVTLTISGIVRQKEGTSFGLLSSGIAYSDSLSELVLSSSLDSEIVKAQQESDINIMTGEKLDEAGKQQLMSYLGGDSTPYMIMVFPLNFDAKDQVTAYLDEFNEGKALEDQIIYTDLAETMSEMTNGIMDGITIVLVAFAGISLVVSLIMICIITYTSVLERTKEIGILRALGARKKDITRVFDAETCILGVFSGLLGVFIAWLLTFPINNILYQLTELEGVSHLQLAHAVLLVAISTVLTVLGGHIPSKMASRKDAVEALRSE